MRKSRVTVAGSAAAVVVAEVEVAAEFAGNLVPAAVVVPAAGAAIPAIVVQESLPAADHWVSAVLQADPAVQPGQPQERIHLEPLRLASPRPRAEALAVADIPAAGLRLQSRSGEPHSLILRQTSRSK